MLGPEYQEEEETDTEEREAKHECCPSIERLVKHFGEERREEL
jgi:hypothetical protein